MTDQQGDQAWFEWVYAKANGQTDDISWADLRPNPFMLKWFAKTPVQPAGKSAVVVGCGLGDDAEELARRGFNVTAFDVSPTAVEWCKRRFPNSHVNYTVGDLFNLPTDWQFDFVLEINTVQAIPLASRQQVMNAVASLVAPGGTLLAIGRLADSAEQQVKRPWPLTREEVDLFKQSGLTETHFETFGDSEIAALRLLRFLVVYVR